MTEKNIFFINFFLSSNISIKFLSNTAKKLMSKPGIFDFKNKFSTLVFYYD